MGTKKALQNIGNLENGNEKTNFRALDVMFGKKYFENKFFIIFFSFLQKAIMSTCPHRYNSFLSIDELWYLFRCKTKFSILTKEEMYGNRQGELIF